MWESPSNAHLTNSLEEITPLLDIIVNYGLEMVLPRDIPTLEARTSGNWTRPDNVWRSPNDLDPTIYCNVDAGLRPELTDHLPVLTTLQFPVARSTEKPYRSYRSVKWDAYREELTTHLPPLPEHEELNTQEAMDKAVHLLTKAIQTATAAQVPFSKPIPTTRRWWTTELSEGRKTRNRLSREHFQMRGLPDHPIHAEYRANADDFVKKVRVQKETHYTEWITGITGGTDLWDANRFISSPASDLSKQRIPALKRTDGTSVTANELKSEILATAFFPPPPTSPIILSAPHPTPVGVFKQYSAERTLDAISKTKAHKAPGPDGIPNILLIKCADLISAHLTIIYNATFAFNIYPALWRESTTIVLRKPGKTDYGIAGAYRPIVLLNTMAKVLSAMVAADLTYLSEKHDLLPNNQFGGRPGRSTTEALHLLTQTVKAAWRAGDVVSILFLDIKAAFPNVVKPVLLNNMRLRGIPEEYVKFTEAMLTNRTTRLSFDDFISADFDIVNGNGQGCPLSMIFYSFYIAPLLEVAKANKKESALGFVDDTSLMARGRDFAETHSILKDMMERADGCLNWSLMHNSPFEIGKLAVMDFTHSAEKKAASTDLQIAQLNATGISTIRSTETYKLLGVCLDPKLNFHQHHDLVLARAVQWTALFRRINRMTKGLSLKFARQLYIAVAVPRITYAADVWYIPPHRKLGAKRQSGKVGLTKKLDSIQRLAAIAITGAMNGVAGDVAALHASIPSSRFMLLETCYKAVTRLSTRPKAHPLNQYIQRAARGQVRSHNTNLHLLLEMSDLDPKLSEEIQPVRRHPNFKSHFDTRIIPNKEAALQWDNEHRKDECMIYTDGSGYEGGIGAAAVLYIDGVKQSSLKLHLGTDEEHTVFEAELTGILLGLHLAGKLNHDFDHINFSLDNQAAIRDIHHRKPHPSHYLLDEIHLAAEAAHDIGRYPAPTSMSLTWVPGHSNAEGNEEADTIAKQAAEGASSPTYRLPRFLRKPLPLSASAAKQRLKQQIKLEQRQEWQCSSRYNRLNRIDPSLPSRKFLSLTSDLTRAQASLLTQLRTNHIPLNANLHRIKKLDNPMCLACNEADENINHFLFICPAYRTPRLKIERALKRSAANLETLLADKDGFQHLLRYIQETGRFQHLSKSLRPDPSDHRPSNSDTNRNPHVAK